MANYVKDDKLCIIHRVAFLHKYIKHNGNENHLDAYNVLLSLIHGRDKCKYADNTEIPIYNKQKGDAEIKIWISDFDYEKIYIEMYNEKKLAELYNSETNNYLKVQLFRAILS